MITTQQLDDLNAKLERATKNAALHNLRKYRAVLPWDWLGDLMTHGKNRIWAKLSPQEILAMADEDLTKLAQDSNEFRKAIRRRKVTTSLEDLLKKGDLKDLGRGAPSQPQSGYIRPDIQRCPLGYVATGCRNRVCALQRLCPMCQG